MLFSKIVSILFCAALIQIRETNSSKFKGLGGIFKAIFNFARGSPKGGHSKSTSPAVHYKPPGSSNNDIGHSNSRPAPPPYGGPPPPYPGYGSAKHSPPNLKPPPYTRFGGKDSHPGSKPYGTYGVRNHGSPVSNTGHIPYYRNHGTNNGTQWGRSPNNPIFGPFRTGYGGIGNPYGSGFGFGKKRNANVSFGSHLGTFVAGAMLWNLASNAGRSNFHVFHKTQKTIQVDPSQDSANFKANFDNPTEAKISMKFGNVTCLTIYNAKKFAEWAYRTIQNVQSQTNQSFPFDFSLNKPSVQFNFTLEPGPIIHNETISITCCGSEQIVLDYEDAFRGHDPHTNCFHQMAKIPFRKIKVTPLSWTYIVTKKEMDALEEPIINSNSH